MKQKLESGSKAPSFRVALATSWPNNALQLTAYSLRSCVAAAIGAAHRQRSASNGRLSWSEQAYNILSQYQAILDIATYLSLNKLFGRRR
jgi:hypothetical protein